MTTIAVISLVVLAGGSRWFGFLEKRISPVDASIVMAARELIIAAKQLEEIRRKNKGNKSKLDETAFFRFLSVCPTKEGFLNFIRQDIKASST